MQKTQSNSKFVALGFVLSGIILFSLQPQFLAAATPTEFDPSGRDWPLAKGDEFAPPGGGGHIASGIGIEALWTTTMGLDRVLIAMPLAPAWGEPDLRTRWWLNRGELQQGLAPKNDSPDVICGGWTASATDFWDINGDGHFDIDDYACDLRVDPAAGGAPWESVLDPGDLIANPVFADGIDNDANTVVDDLVGYAAASDRGLGTADSVARDAWLDAAASADGSGRIGACPGCRIVPMSLPSSLSPAQSVRVADWFKSVQVAVYGEPRPERWQGIAAASPIWSRLMASTLWFFAGEQPVGAAALGAISLASGHYDRATPADSTTMVAPLLCSPESAASIIIPANTCGPEAVARGAGLAALAIAAEDSLLAAPLKLPERYRYFQQSVSGTSPPSAIRIRELLQQGWHPPTATFTVPAASGWWGPAHRAVTAEIVVRGAETPFSWQLVYSAGGIDQTLDSRINTSGDVVLREELVPDILDRIHWQSAAADRATFSLQVSEGTDWSVADSRTFARLRDIRLRAGYPITVDTVSPLLLAEDRKGYLVVLRSGAVQRFTLRGTMSSTLYEGRQGIAVDAVFGALDSSDRGAVLYTDGILALLDKNAAQPLTRAVGGGWESLSMATAGGVDLLFLSGPAGHKVVDFSGTSVTRYTEWNVLPNLPGNQRREWSAPALPDLDQDGWPDPVWWETDKVLDSTDYRPHLKIFWSRSGNISSNPILAAPPEAIVRRAIGVSEQLPQPLAYGNSIAAHLEPGLGLNVLFQFNGGVLVQAFGDFSGRIPDTAAIISSCQWSGVYDCAFYLRDAGLFGGTASNTVNFLEPSASTSVGYPVTGEKGSAFALLGQDEIVWLAQSGSAVDILVTGIRGGTVVWLTNDRDDNTLSLVVPGPSGEIALYDTQWRAHPRLPHSARINRLHDGRIDSVPWSASTDDEAAGCSAISGGDPLMFLLLAAGALYRLWRRRQLRPVSAR